MKKIFFLSIAVMLTATAAQSRTYTNQEVESLNITGHNTVKNCNVSESVTSCGLLSCRGSNINSLDSTGNTTLNNATLKTLKITGKASLTNCEVGSAEIIGLPTASDCSVKSLKVTTNTATLTDCDIQKLHVLKTAKPTTIHIKATQKGTTHRIIKIVCDDPTTIISYGPNTARADTITGTANITYA